MSEAGFLERRTRSQLALPDDVLQIPEMSPLKSARTALKSKNSIAPSLPYKDSPNDSTDDELLLSPRKMDKLSFSSKRSASPPPQDEYTPGSGPSDGRELKRSKRDLSPTESGTYGHNISNAQRKRLLPSHTRTHSDSNVAVLQRSSTRKRSATTSKKPKSTVSASPYPTPFSPAQTTPKKDRALSVPLFPSTYSLPRVDFRNISPSPKRFRSRSRSPSKEAELKQHIPSGAFVGSSSLPIIRDENPDHMDVNQVKDGGGFGVETTMTKKPAGRETSFPTHVSTLISQPNNPTPSGLSSSATPPILSTIPATPISQSLNKLIPLSPLTPLPETPFTQQKTSHAEDRFAGSHGWNLGPTSPTTLSHDLIFPGSIDPSTNEKPLPRPLLVPIVDPPKSSRSEMMGPPLPPKFKQANILNRKAAIATTKNASQIAAPVKAARNAFDVLMKKRPMDAERPEREKGKSSRPSAIPRTHNMFHSSSSGGQLSLAVGSSQSKVKIKSKMRPREKLRLEKPHAVAPISDEEDEDEDSTSSDPWRTSTEPESEIEADKQKLVIGPSAPPIAVELLEPVERPTAEELAPQIAVLETTVNAIDNIGNRDEPTTEIGVPYASGSRKEVVVRQFEISMSNKGVIRPITARNEAIADISPSTKLEISPPLQEPASEEDQGETQPQLDPELQPSIAEEPVLGESKKKGTLQPESNPQPSSRAISSKLPLGRKRQPISVPPANRVTRSISNRTLSMEVDVPRPGRSMEANRFTPARRKPLAAMTKSVPVSSEESLQDVTETDTPMDVVADTNTLPPGSPMKLGSLPEKILKRKTPVRSPMKFSLGKQASSLSSARRARSSVALSSKPTSECSTFSSSYQVNMGSTSSLSTLSNALEKLRMPAPSRPNTSMGFNRNMYDDDDNSLARSKDDTAVGRVSPGIAPSARDLKRAFTLGANSLADPSSSRTDTSSRRNFVQKPIAMFMSDKGSNVKTTTSLLARGIQKPSILGSKPLFGIGGGLRRTISKKTTLPVVIASPVKGCETDDVFRKDEESQGDRISDNTNLSKSTVNEASTDLTLADVDTAGTRLAKFKEESSGKVSNASRRVSMVSHALSQSLNMPPPPPPARGLMDPLPTSPSARTTNRSTSSSYPSTSAGSSSPSYGTRSSARLAKVAAQTRAKGVAEGQASAGKKIAVDQTLAQHSAVEALKVLKDCVIFVDVKTDDGEEAGSLFVQMLEGVGARVLTRVGQTCTHIIHKNGLMSTVTRYRLLRDPKPLVVGIGWVVECVEQRKHLDEKDFLVDLENTHVAGVNKRRRSMLPRLFATELSFSLEPDNKDECGEADQLIDDSSINMYDGLPPLERARRRKSTIVGTKI